MAEKFGETRGHGIYLVRLAESSDYVPRKDAKAQNEILRLLSDGEMEIDDLLETVKRGRRALSTLVDRGAVVIDDVRVEYDEPEPEEEEEKKEPLPPEAEDVPALDDDEAGAEDRRYRRWTLICYPESCPGKPWEILAKLALKGFVSPLHDEDVNPTGEKKKPHWHVALEFNGKKSLSQVKAIAQKLGTKVRPRVAVSWPGLVRYLTHMDNPEKAQYSADDVHAFGGADYIDAIDSAGSVDDVLGEIMRWCVENACSSFAALSLYALDREPTWFRVISAKRTLFLSTWLKSLKWDLGQKNSETMRVLDIIGYDKKEEEDEEDEGDEEEDGLLCEICGGVAVGGCNGPDGVHLFCEEHREAVLSSVPEEWETDAGLEDEGGTRVADAPTTPPLGSLVDGQDLGGFSGLGVETAGKDMYAGIGMDVVRYAEKRKEDGETS